MGDIVELAMEELQARGAADAAALAARAVSGEADGTELIGKAEQIPTWRQRDYSQVPVGSPYRYNGQVYKLWQQHDATDQPDWTPEGAVSLWDICHTTDPACATQYTAPQGTRGLWQSGEFCLFGGQVWKCVMANTSWSPEEYPQAWELYTE